MWYGDCSPVLPGHTGVVVAWHFLTDNQREMTAGQDGDPWPTCEIE